MRFSIFSIFLISQVFIFASVTVFAQEKSLVVEISNSIFSETDPLSEVKENAEFAGKTPQLVVRVNPAPFVDWELNTNLERIQSPEFLGQFSMKRGYRLEPFLRNLTPEIAVRIRCDIFQTVHECYCESVLAPAQVWCREHGATLQFCVPPLSGARNASMILDEEQFATEIYVCDIHNSPAVRIAASIVLARGYLYVSTKERKLSFEELPDSESLILLPDKQTYDFDKEPESYRGSHLITENEFQYATIIQKNSIKILGVGAAEYKTLIIHPDFEKVYTPVTVRILNRFRAEGMKVE